MRLHTQLQFADIAKRWWRELANTPREIELRDIRAELFRASLDGEFDDADLQYLQPLRDKEVDGKWERIPAHPVSVTGAWLATVLAVGISLRSRNIDGFDSISVAIWDEITVGRDGFGRWCDDHGHPRPAFWFEQPHDAPREKQGKRGRKPWDTTPAIQKMIPIVEADKDGIGGSATPTAMRAYFKKKGITKSAPRTFHDDFRNAYIENRDTLHWEDQNGNFHKMELASLAAHRRALEKV